MCHVCPYESAIGHFLPLRKMQCEINESLIATLHVDSLRSYTTYCDRSRRNYNVSNVEISDFYAVIIFYDI